MALPALLTGNRPGARSLLRTRRGWIGVDLGTAATKVVQLEKTGDQVRMTARWLIRDYLGGELTAETLASGCFPFLIEPKQVRSAFHGKVAAATLPTSLIQTRNLEIPPGSDDELRSMIQDELVADASGGEKLAFDFLEATPPDSFEGDTQPYFVFAAPAPLTIAAATALGTAGLECEVIDTSACALARAVTLCEEYRPDEPIAALDVGASTALLTISRAGRLQFARQLRGWGLKPLLRPLVEGLRITASEAEQLLIQSAGIETASTDPRLTAALAGITKAAHELVALPLFQLAAEVKRTLDFIDLQFRSLIPRRLVLFGGGALVPGLPEAVAETTHLPVRPWRLEGGAEPPRREDALFGVAAGLSCLAWEATR